MTLEEALTLKANFMRNRMLYQLYEAFNDVELNAAVGKESGQLEEALVLLQNEVIRLRSLK